MEQEWYTVIVAKKMTIATDVIAKLVRSLPVLSGITEFGFFCLPNFPMLMFTDDVITCQPTPHPNQTLYRCSVRMRRRVLRGGHKRILT